MPTIQRVTIDTVLAGAEERYSSRQIHEARSLEAIRRTAVALDHIVNRSHEEYCRVGEIRTATKQANEADLIEARHHLGTLRLAAELVEKMITGMEEQLAPPQPDPNETLEPEEVTSDLPSSLDPGVRKELLGSPNARPRRRP